jgi:putative colanic acid biosynthesis glycosyltransferase WcaI
LEHEDDFLGGACGARTARSKGWGLALRILLLNQYFPPDTSATARIAESIVMALAKRHQVTVLSGRPSYNPEESYPFSFLRRDDRDGFVVERVGSTAYPRHRMKRRIANYLTYVSLMAPRALALKADVVIAMTDPPFAGIVGAAVARMKRVPFVYYIQDLYPDMAIGGEIVRQRSWVNLWERMHRRALRQAARVIVIGDDMRARILSKGVASDRVAVIHNGMSIPARAGAPSTSLINEIRGTAKFVVLHAGNLGFYGAWPALIGAAKILNGDGTQIVFVGDGANRARLEEASRGFPAVRFISSRPIAEMSQGMVAGDLHVVTIRRGLEGVVVPSKLYSILAAGRPVLVVAPGESDAARIVRENDCGVVVDPDRPAEVAAAIRALRNDPARLESMGKRAREAASGYAKVDELEKFVRFVEDAADSHPQEGLDLDQEARIS